MEPVMTKSKGIGRGGLRKGAGRPRFRKTGKASYLAIRITQETRDRVEDAARQTGDSLSTFAEGLLLAGLRERIDRRERAAHARTPLRAFLFLVRMLNRQVTGSWGSLQDRPEHYWRENPYMFAAFAGGISYFFDALKPPGDAVAPPPTPNTLLADPRLGLALAAMGAYSHHRAPDDPQEHGRDCAKSVLAFVQMATFDHRHREEGEVFSDDHYGFVDALEDLKISSVKYLTDTEGELK
jgi:hypothetical protein